ncbi:MAG: WD40/YVTN/BNR-like repeat-containing protein [Candidatus Binatia bacterium]
MAESLRYYIAHNGGLKVMEPRGASFNTIGEFFQGKTLEHLTGGVKRPELLFAAVAFDGGYRSEDGGDNWTKVMEGDVRTFSIDPYDERVVYMGIGPIRLFRSEDSGKSWEALDGMLNFGDEVKKKWDVPARLRGVEFPHVRHIFIHPDDQNLIWILLEHGGVLLSKDRGQTWYDRSAGIDYVDMHYIENFPGSKERYYVSSARGFFRSDNAGEHWRRVESGMPWAYTELHSYSHEWHFMPGASPRMVLCGGKGSPGVWSRERTTPLGHILLSDDGGESWRISTNVLEKENPYMQWVLLRHPLDGNALFCGLGDGARGYGFDARITGKGAFYASRDRGDSWEPVLKDTPSILTAWVAPN